MRIDDLIADLASVQAGTFARFQVLDLGGDDDLIHRRRASGSWLTYRPGVYGFPDHRDNWDRRLWIVYLTAGQDAAVSYDSAAVQYGAPGFTRDELHLTVPHPHHQRATRVGWDTLRFPWEELVGDAEDAAATLLDTWELRRDLLLRAG